MGLMRDNGGPKLPWKITGIHHGEVCCRTYSTLSPVPPARAPYSSSRFPFPHTFFYWLLLKASSSRTDSIHTSSHVRLLRVSLRPPPPRDAASQAQGRPSWTRWTHNWPFGQEEGLQGLPVLSSTQGEVQCHRARSPVYELQTRRGRMHRL